MQYDRIIESLKSGKRKPSDRELVVEDEDGWTVAHWWALNNKPGNGFKYWDLSDENGWTVAHAAASAGHLSDDFNQWGLKDEKGDTVAHIYVRFTGFAHKSFSADFLKTKNNAGVSIWDDVRSGSKKILKEIRIQHSL